MKKDMQQLVVVYRELKKKRTELEAEKAKLDAQLKEIQSNMDILEADALETIEDMGVDAYTYDGMTVSLMCRNSRQYDNVEALISELKAQGLNQLVRVKEELNKVELNKALKDDDELNDLVNRYSKESQTRYVVITSEENTQKMREHINESKQKKQNA